MIYYFQGMERLSLWLENPNVAAGLLAMLITVLCGVALYAFSWQRRKMAVFGYCVCMLLAAFGMLLLAMTYSRGGYVTMLAVTLAFPLLYFFRNWRKEGGQACRL